MNNRQKFFRVVTLMLTVFFSQILAGREMLRINENENAKTISLEMGDTFEVFLESNPTTGYQWVVDELEPIILKQGESDFIGTLGVGSGGNQVLYFNVIGKGKTVLKLAYRRTFEVGVAPLKSFKLNIVVKDN
jgi:inhibitor of cysteine peptidase